MKKLFIETYGCQMNVADSEVVASILSSEYQLTENESEADLILINTCSVRDNAEQRIRARLRELGSLKKKRAGLMVGLLGCMAERIKNQLLGLRSANTTFYLLNLYCSHVFPPYPLNTLLILTPLF